MSRTKALALTAALAAPLALGTAWTLHPLSSADATTRDPVAARAAAERACTGAASAQEAVAQHAPPAEVLLWLDRAVGTAREAAALDPVWVPLLSGLQLLHFSLSGSDGTDAVQGLALVRRSCAAR